MKPFQRLCLIIVASSLLPTLAVVWSRCNASREEAQRQLAIASLRLALKEIALYRSVEPETADGRAHEVLTRWLHSYAGHPCASLIREPMSRIGDYPQSRPFHLGTAEEAARVILNDCEKR
jgi:hypothetical protein